MIMNWEKKLNLLSTQTKVITENKGFYHPEIGYNYRMPNLLAAMGCAQLEKIQEYINTKREHALLYNELLKDVKRHFYTKREILGKKMFIGYIPIVVEEDFPITRDQLIEKLWESKIETRPFLCLFIKCLHLKNVSMGDMRITL